MDIWNLNSNNIFSVDTEKHRKLEGRREEVINQENWQTSYKNHNYNIELFSQVRTNFSPLLLIGVSPYIYVPLVLGAFDDPEITHVDDTVDPVRDLETISEELRLKVLFVLPKNLMITFTCYLLLSCFSVFSNKALPRSLV